MNATENPEPKLGACLEAIEEVLSTFPPCVASLVIVYDLHTNGFSVTCPQGSEVASQLAKNVVYALARNGALSKEEVAAYVAQKDH